MRSPLFLRAAAILSALCLPYKLVHGQDGPTSGFDVFTTPTDNQEIPAGSNFEIIWVPSAPAGKVSIILMEGGSELDQDDGPTIASGIDSAPGKYTWSIPSSYGDFASYGFRLQLDSNPKTFQYSYAFRIKKDPNSPPTSKSRPSSRTPTSSTATQSGPTGDPPSSPSSFPGASTTGLPATSSIPSSAKPYATSSTSPSGSSGTISPTATGAGSSHPNSAQSASASASSLQTGAPSSHGDNNLSTAAKVGIAVGGATAICTIILLVYIALLMRRRNALRKTPAEGLELAEDDKSVDSKEHKISELESAMVSEMMSEMRLELDGKSGAGELPGSDTFDKRPRDKRKTLDVIHEVHELP